MHVTLDREELPGLLFGQQHVLTQCYFVSRHGQHHTVRLDELPHYQLLCAGPGDPSATEAYEQYLECSWSYYRPAGNDREHRRRRSEAFLRLYEEIGRRRQMGERAVEQPIRVCRRPDGRVVIVDGNHRAAIALRLGLPLRAELVPLPEQLASTVAVPDEFYGTQRLERPYQSVVRRGVELVSGRRPDIAERIAMIADEDLAGQTVLDLGCNIGMNCYLSAERGAAAAVGVEVSPAIASGAVRLNAYFAEPCYFVAHDASQVIDGLPPFDTVLCFSVIDHVPSRRGLAEVLRRLTGRVLYFEGHAGTSRSDYAGVLRDEDFSRIDLIGHGHDGVHADTRTRPLFRCEVRPGETWRDAPAAEKGSDVAALFREHGPAWRATIATLGRRQSAASPAAVGTEIASIVPDGQTIILVDEEQVRAGISARHQYLPFLERGGQYWGPPPDDATAIRELQRLRGAGADFIAFWRGSFWWLDHYAGFHRHLRETFRVALENDRLVVFDLRAAPRQRPIQ
jgi:SAM-dependent methyltransferase